MDVNFLSAVRNLPSLRQEADIEVALSELLTKTSGGPLTIKGVRDKFSTVNRLAKSGQIQVVKGAPGEETVIVSVKALAAIIRAAAASLSFTDALAAAGFVPTGQPLLQSENFRYDDALLLGNEDQIQSEKANDQMETAQMASVDAERVQAESTQEVARIR